MVWMVAGSDASLSGATPIRLQDIAETIYCEAVSRVRGVTTPTQPRPDLEQLLQDGAALQKLTFGLAEGMANVLAASDERVLSVHYFEEDARPDERPEREGAAGSKIHLLVLVRSRSAALEALAAALDGALTDAVRDLSSLPLDRHASLLNPVLITEEEVEQRRGLALFLAPASTSLLTVWERERPAGQNNK